MRRQLLPMAGMIFLAACGSLTVQVEPMAASTPFFFGLQIEPQDTATPVTEPETMPVNQSSWPEGASSIAAGYVHTCAVTAAGGVACWGDNTFGQLGTGTLVDSGVPAAVAGLERGMTAVAAGWGHTCALSEAGGVYCWGNNKFGQAGATGAVNPLVPAKVEGLPGAATSIAVGDYHSCAVTRDGGVSCWGQGTRGQLGDGFGADGADPVEVRGLEKPVVLVAAGRAHTCALARDGSVRCWGDNTSGQLGVGSGEELFASAVEAVRLSAPATGLAAGGGTTCVLLADTRTICWGDGAVGQLGVTLGILRTAPREPVELEEPAVRIAVGRNHACAVLESGGIACWGSNEAYKLGDPFTRDTPYPQRVAGLGELAVFAAAGWRHTCAVMDTGVVRCWGSKDRGQLGHLDATEPWEPVWDPVRVDGLLAWVPPARRAFFPATPTPPSVSTPIVSPDFPPTPAPTPAADK